MKFNDPPWHPMNNPIDIKHIGKLLEELGELVSASARCLIQGTMGKEPTTLKYNYQWLGEEIADVNANINLVMERFSIEQMIERQIRKQAMLNEWHIGA